jgi:predicted nucleic acid-binding Zn ribbon protein
LGCNEILSKQKERQKNPFGFMAGLEEQFLEVP